MRSPRRLFGGAVALCLTAVAAALVSQHAFDMQPCPWCVLQRLIFLALAVAALPGLLMKATPARIISAALMLVLAACGAAAALWQHFVAAASKSCNQTLADRIVSGIGLDAQWPEVFEARASCADAAVSVLGVPYALYSLALFVLLAGFALASLRAGHRRI